MSSQNGNGRGPQGPGDTMPNGRPATTSSWPGKQATTSSWDAQRQGSGPSAQQGPAGTPGGQPAIRGVAPETNISLSAVQEMRRPAAQAPTPIEAPTPSLPKGGGAIRAISEKFSLNPATGSGGMSIPVQTPPGRSGFGPSLAIGYSSGGGNGPFGLGWSLSAPSIRRKTDKGLPQYMDRNDSDTFVLSGAEDLVPYLDGGGTRLSNETTVDNITTLRERYRPRTEGDFSRVVRVTVTNPTTSSRSVHWEVTTPDNVTHVYGKTAQARIADPKHPSWRIFSWLLEESRDDRGNVVLYEYKPEDRAGVPVSAHEHHRAEGLVDVSANRYLKRIHYGNLASVTTPTTEADFHFEVVFDYGEHTASPPTRDDSQSDWAVRQDPFSSYRAGFEVRAYRLCQRILTFHKHFDESGNDLNGGTDTLVAMTELTYDPSGTVTYLSEAKHTGYDGAATQSLPATTFTYSTSDTFSTKVHDFDGASLSSLPQGIDGRAYQWIDLDGEGVPGVLSQLTSGALTYKRNLGQGKLAPAQQLQTRPSTASFGLRARAGQQLRDVTGNGLPDLVEMDRSGAGAGFFARDAYGDDASRTDGTKTGAGWLPRRSFQQVPNVDYADPSLRFIDLTGDGFADIMMSESHVYTWYPAQQTRGFDGPKRSTRYSDEASGPALVFAEAEQTVFLADMSGDGLQDLVRVRNGSVCYWPNLGYGQFGPCVRMDSAPTMAPDNLYSPSRVRLADLDGTGAADLLYLGADGVYLYRNASGNSFQAAERLAVFPGHDGLSSVDVIDLLGTGTACLVWSTPLRGKSPQLRYVNLFEDETTGLTVKPHLLVGVDNGLGMETKLRYSTSTLQYLEDQQSGIDWASRLPFPVQVVDRVEHYDHIAKHRFVSTYAYRHGHYDPEEREFRGFGYVEQRDAESVDGDVGEGLFDGLPDEDENGELPQPPVVTKTWFHTGAFKRAQKLLQAYEAEWFQPDTSGGKPDEPRLSMPALPSGLSAAETHQAHRALAGSMLRQEVYAEDGAADADKPYVVSQQTFAVRREQPTGDSPYAVFFVTPEESLSIQYERLDDVSEARVAHEMTLEVDALGHVTKAVSVAYGHGSSSEAEQTKRWLVGTEQGMLDVNAASASAADEPYRHGLSKWAKSWELDDTAPGGGAALYTRSELETAFGKTEVDFETRSFTSSQKRLLTHTRTLYTNDSGSAVLDYDATPSVGTRALVHETLALALNPVVFGTGEALEAATSSVATSEGGYRKTSDFTGFDAGEGEGSAHETSPVVPDEDALWVGSGTQSYDASHFYLVDEATDVFGNTTTVAYDSYKLAVVKVTDAVGNEVESVIDYRVLSPKKVIDINDNVAEAAFDPLGRVTATAVSNSDGSKGDTLSDPTTRLTYADGQWSGSSLPNYVKTEMREQHGGTASWLESYAYTGGVGEVGLTKTQVEPEPVTPPATPVPRWVASGRTVIDNKGNPIKQYEPYFSTTSAYELDLMDVGVTPVMHYDPLGRLIRADLPDGTHTRVVFSPWEQLAYDQNDTVTDDTTHPWYEARKSSASPAPHAKDTAAAAAALLHADTPTRTRFDSLGRPYEVEQRKHATDTNKWLTTKTELDVEGHVLSVTDARNNTCMSYTYGPLGQVLALSSIDAGERWMLDGATGQPVRAGGQRGITQRVTYDALRRPTGVYVEESSVEKKVQEMTYGEGSGYPNAKGKLVQLRDQSGQVTVDDFDFKGNPLVQKRKYADDYQSRLDWAASTPPSLMTEEWEHEFSYDALNRPTSTIYPDNPSGTGTEVLPEYDAGGMLKRVTAKLRGASTATVIVDDITYDEKGRRERIVYSDKTGNHVYTDYTYDPLSFRLKYFKTTRSSGTGDLLQSLHYHYDAVGNITATRDTSTAGLYFTTSGNPIPDADADYTYDAIYRLIEAEGREHRSVIGQLDHNQPTPETIIPHAMMQNPLGLHRYTQTYAYDDVGNITEMAHAAGTANNWTRQYTYPSTSNRLTSTKNPASGGTTVNYTHDVHGNITAMPHLDTIDWDYADQMRHVDKLGDQTQEVWFVYDASGERVRKVYKHGQYRDERFYIGGVEVFRRYVSGSLDTERETVHLSDDHRRVCMAETKTVSGGGTVTTPVTKLRFQLDNHLGTCAVEVEEDGAIISYEEYHPYGTSAYRAQSSSVDVSAKRYRYTGKERDESTGLYYHGARYYAPWLGRWTAADPLSMADGTGSYDYARTNPVVLADPNGKRTYREAAIASLTRSFNNLAILLEDPKENADLIDITTQHIASLQYWVFTSDPIADQPEGTKRMAPRTDQPKSVPSSDAPPSKKPLPGKSRADREGPKPASSLKFSESLRNFVANKELSPGGSMRREVKVGRSIGYGQDVLDVETRDRLRRKYGAELSDAEADDLLRTSLRGQANAIRNKLGDTKVTQGQFDALVSQGFNAALFSATFKSRTIDAIKSGRPIEEVTALMLDSVTTGEKNYSKGAVVGLVIRRFQEIQLFYGRTPSKEQELTPLAEDFKSEYDRAVNNIPKHKKQERIDALAPLQQKYIRRLHEGGHIP